MKNLELFLIAIGLLVSVQSFAQDYNYKQDVFDKEKINILNSYGNNVER